MPAQEFDRGDVIELLNSSEGLNLGMASDEFVQIIGTPSVVFLDPNDIHGSMGKIMGKDAEYLADNSVNYYYSSLEKMEKNGLVVQVGSIWVAVAHLNEDGAIDQNGGSDPTKVNAVVQAIAQAA
jgi:hypothetical protein